MKFSSTGARASAAVAGLLAWLVLPDAVSAARAKKATFEAPSTAAAESYPKLPAVSAMMGAASETLRSVNSQASVLEARVAQAQLEDEAKLARQKAVFEQKLRAQEARNKQEVRANAEISREIEMLKANNTELKKRAAELQEGNRLMRTELHALKGRLSSAEEFAASSLKSSDDGQAPELDVLRPPTAAVHKAHHRRTKVEQASQAEGSAAGSEESQGEQDDKDSDADEKDGDQDDDDDSEGGAASLLALAERVRRTSRAGGGAAAAVAAAADAELPGAEADAAQASNPKDLLAVLSKGVTDLQREEKESEAKLKSIFLASFRAGTKRRAGLIAQQRSLNATRTSLQALRTKLQAADRRLEGTRAGLERRLRSLGLFEQKLAHLALAPATEVPHLLQALPQDVAAAPVAKQTE